MGSKSLVVPAGWDPINGGREVCQFSIEREIDPVHRTVDEIAELQQFSEVSNLLIGLWSANDIPEECLSTTEVNLLVQGELAEPDLLLCKDHLRHCGDCRKKVSDKATELNLPRPF